MLSELADRGAFQFDFFSYRVASRNWPACRAVKPTHYVGFASLPDLYKETDRLDRESSIEMFRSRQMTLDHNFRITSGRFAGYTIAPKAACSVSGLADCGRLISVAAAAAEFNRRIAEEHDRLCWVHADNGKKVITWIRTPRNGPTYLFRGGSRRKPGQLYRKVVASLRADSWWFLEAAVDGDNVAFRLVDRKSVAYGVNGDKFYSSVRLGFLAMRFFNIQFCPGMTLRKGWNTFSTDSHLFYLPKDAQSAEEDVSNISSRIRATLRKSTEFQQMRKAVLSLPLSELQERITTDRTVFALRNVSIEPRGDTDDGSEDGTAATSPSEEYD